ncbi:hypothetical protein DL96DRAFT_1634557 [Flagelloscypha sp. PMI_526]|nr:hypothetical protein DL96DRAFT_1634557 [Flagelloscypha sp. PMI_526]
MNDDSVPLVCDSPHDNLSVLSKSVQALGLEEDRTLFDVLNGDVLEYIFLFLTGLELCLLRSVCKVSHSTVDEYMSRAFSVDRIFSRFFAPHAIPEFRRIQGETNFFMSGSAAVQFFGCVNYPNSNLDLYINEDHMKKSIQAPIIKFRVPFG